MSNRRALASSFIYLQWHVSLEGYTTLKGFPGIFLPIDLPVTSGPEGPILVAASEGLIVDWPMAAPSRIYCPMDIPGLHRVFADAELSDAGLIAFANKYGMLGRCFVQLMPSIGGDPTPLYDGLEYKKLGKTGFDAIYGEPLLCTRYHVTKMRALLRMIEIATTSKDFDRDIAEYWNSFAPLNPERDRHRFADVDVEIPTPGYELVPLPRKGVFGSQTAYFPYCPPYVMRQLKLGTDRKPFCLGVPKRSQLARFLEAVINRELDEGAQARISLRAEARLVLEPRDLLGAVYAHLALELSDQTSPLRRCPSCQSWFEPVHLRQKYCEDRCKTKAYRTRRKA